MACQYANHDYTDAELLIDCDRPAARDCVVRWLAEQGLDYGWARDIPGALVEAVRRCVAGEEPLQEHLTGPLKWTGSVEAGWVLECADGWDWACVTSHGWRSWATLPAGPLHRTDEASGPETGDEGKRLAEAAVRHLYWVMD